MIEGEVCECCRVLAKRLGAASEVKMNYSKALLLACGGDQKQAAELFEKASGMKRKECLKQDDSGRGSDG